MVGRIVLLAIIILAVFYYQRWRKDHYSDRGGNAPVSRRVDRGYPDVNLIGAWRGFGTLLGYYTVKYVDYGEYEAAETTSGKIYSLRPVGNIDIFITTPEKLSLKGTMQWDSRPSVTEIIGDAFTLRRE
jgi:hypothetical protein